MSSADAINEIPLENNKKDHQNGNKIKSEPILLNSKVISPSSTSISESNKFQIKTKSVDSAAELIGILEGKDDIKKEVEDNIHLVQSNKNNDESLKKLKNNCEGVLTILSKDEERMIALEQMSNFNKKTKNKTEKSNQNQAILSGNSPEMSENDDKNKPENDDIVSEIYQDWSDNEKETTLIVNTSENEIIIKPVNEKKQIKKTVKQSDQQVQNKPEQQNVQERNHSRRIVKKKIIWDPDAPETGISYASLIKTTNRKVNKVAVLKSSPKKSPQASAAKKLAIKEVITETKEKQAVKPQIVAKTLNKISKNQIEKIPKLPPKKQAIKETEVIEESKRKRKPTQFIVGHITVEPTTDDDKDTAVTPTKQIKLEKIDRIVKDEPNTAGDKSPVNNKKTELIKKYQIKKEVNGGTTLRKRGAVKAPKLSDTTWEFLYNVNQVQNDDAMIARRRSNSSYSSTTSPRRLSLELPSATAADKKLGATSKQSKKKTGFEFAKPVNKKKTINETDNNSIIAGDIKPTTRKSLRNSTPTAIPDAKSVDKKANDVKEIDEDYLNIKKIPNEKLVHIILNLKSTNNKYNAKIMNKIIEQLEYLKTDSNCNAVILSSSKGQSFCQGLELSSLIVPAMDKRKQAAQELSNILKSFILTLLTFPKILIAGINGEINNLGVMILPAFDIVIASDSSSFKTNYTNLGYLPEGFCLFSESISHQSLKTKLLYLNETLKCADAISCGLITKSIPQSKLDDSILDIGTKICSMSQQALFALKQQKFDTRTISEKLDEEQKHLILQWTSSECQEKFKF